VYAVFDSENSKIPIRGKVMRLGTKRDPDIFEVRFWDIKEGVANDYMLPPDVLCRTKEEAAQLDDDESADGE
jgi:hypothetical protein